MRVLLRTLLLCTCIVPAAYTQTLAPPLNTVFGVPDASVAVHGAATASGASDGGFLGGWFSRVAQSQSEQPHWMTPVVTVTPLLEQEYRYDIFRQRGGSGIETENYGGGKGLEIIPWRNIEVIFIEPPYIVHNSPNARDGFGDFQILTKYRIIARNEEHGGYVLSAFFQVSFPTGQYKNGSTNPIITPTFAYGKGFRKFDLQGTFGVSLPTGNTNTIGRSYLWNDAFQYHVMKRLWPELEVNYTHFQEGLNGGKTQTFMTPGIIFGRFPIHGRLAFAVGGGFQIATTHFHTNNHNVIFTVRFPF